MVGVSTFTYNWYQSLCVWFLLFSETFLKVHKNWCPSPSALTEAQGWRFATNGSMCKWRSCLRNPHLIHQQFTRICSTDREFSFWLLEPPQKNILWWNSIFLISSDDADVEMWSQHPDSAFMGSYLVIKLWLPFWHEWQWLKMFKVNNKDLLTYLFLLHLPVHGQAWQFVSIPLFIRFFWWVRNRGPDLHTCPPALMISSF